MKSKILDFVFGYEESERNFKESRIAKAEKRFSDRVISGLGSAYAKKFLSHPAVDFITKIRNALAYASVRSYGILLLTFGLLTLLGNFAVYYFSSNTGSPTSELAVGIVCAALAVPLLFIDVPLNDCLTRFAVTEFILFDFLCIKKGTEVNRKREKRDSFVLIPIFVAAALAAFAFLFSPLTVLIIVLSAIFVTLALSSPEFSMLTTLMLLPLIPLLPRSTLIVTALIAVTAISFLIKVLLGKRLFHFEQYDVIILIFMLFTLISGIFNKGIESFENSLVIIALSLTYFLVSNILVNRRLAENAVKIITLSSAPTAVYGIITYYVSDIHTEWTDPMFGERARAFSTFGNPNVYAVYLIVAIVFSLALTFDRSQGRSAILYAVISAMNIYALVVTWTRGAWLAIILSALGFAIIRSRRCPKLLLLPVILIPLAIPFVPSDVIERFLSIFNASDSSAMSRLSIWRSSVLMFFDNLFIGAGVGSESFSEEFLKYAEDGMTAVHSHNLFLEIGCELGVFALLSFIFLLVVRIRHRATYAKYVRGSSVDNLCTISGTALFTLLFFGMTDYIWYNSTMFVLFWAVFGIGSATLRISKKEYDDSLVVTPTEMENHSAQLNIIIESGKKRNV